MNAVRTGPKRARPVPPDDLLIPVGDRFEAAPDLRDWIVATFIAEDGPLANEDHRHLEAASIGVLWTNAPNTKHMRIVIGQTEIMPPMAMGTWPRARAMQQIEEWFGEVPDFLLTFFAPIAATMDDVSFCALVEHELYHAGQERDAYGAPKFTQDGRPKFGIRGHDVEEFVGVVRRYGAAATAVQPLVDAAKARPLIGKAKAAGVCGTCLRLAA